MRKYIVAAVGAAAMVLSLGAASAGPAFNVHPGGGAAAQTVVTLAQWGGHCERLRWRCEHKYQLGQEGEGNCRRYREECGARGNYCERLRRACEFKYERGQEGQGNCRRYREECGGGGRY